MTQKATAAKKTLAKKTPPQPLGGNMHMTVAQIGGGLDSLPAKDTIAMADYLLRQNCGSVAISSGGKYVSELLSTGTEHFELNLKDGRGPFGTVRMAFRLARILRATNADIIHLRSQSLSWPVFMAAKLTNTPLVISVEDSLGAVKRAPLSLFKRADMLISPTQPHKDGLVALGLDAGKITVIPPGYDSLKFDTSNTDTKKVDELWAEWDVPTATRVMYTPTMALEDSAGLHHFITALGQLRHLPFKAIISGDYTHNRQQFTELWQQVEATGLSKHVLFIGTPHDKVNTYAAADMIVCPQVFEPPIMRAPLHALGMGKPVVATNLASHRACVRHGETGWLCEPRDPQKLASILKDALSDNIRLHKMGGLGAKEIPKTHSYKVTCPQIHKLYQQTINQTRQQEAQA